MITEKEISATLGREIKSPIRIGQLTDLGIQTATFIEFFSPFFNQLEDDLYLIKEKQIAYLKRVFYEEEDALESLHKAYFNGSLGTESLNSWINRLDKVQQEDFENLSQVTRQRNIATFILDFEKDDCSIERLNGDGFEQNVDDFRTWNRVFKQAESEMVENELFFKLLKKTGTLLTAIHPDVSKVKVTSHFMRTIAHEKIFGENAPEGVHEDGARYIMSALVINRKNCMGAESQIFEKLANDHQDMVYKKTLAPGEFIFQADTGEECTFGNDLWHYVTPLESLDESRSGIRDIIGFDIDIVV